MVCETNWNFGIFRNNDGTSTTIRSTTNVTAAAGKRTEKSAALLSSTIYLSLVFLVIVIWCPTNVQSSKGDNDKTFHSCLIGCNKFCNSSSNNNEFLSRQPLHLRYLNWDCVSECKYNCMWSTVEAYKEKGAETPQFYGKWPFTRILGLQEPASVLFSIFNLIGHVRGMLAILTKIPGKAPLRIFWFVFSLVCINAWIWSIIFHARDTDFTERMDYLSATAMVMYSFYAVFVRYFERLDSVPVFAIGMAFMSYFLFHIYYLTFVRFDYGYNMKANIAMGVLNTGLWILWSRLQKKHPHTRKAAIFVTLLFSSICLEVYDFPPIFWIIDSHALWHLFTAPLYQIFYSFIVDDCQFLKKKAHFL